EAALRASSQVAAGSGAYAALACIDSWLTDFRGDLARIDVPVLAIHGAADQIVPLGVTTARLRDEHLIDDLTVLEIPDGPHNVRCTPPAGDSGALLSSGGGEGGDRPAERAATG